MRAGITCVGPVLGSIQSGLQLSNGVAGMLTTVPLLAFGALSPLAPRMGERFGRTRAVAVGLLAIGLGALIRVLGGTAALLVGTVVLGLGVALCNVLLPALVKERFPAQVGLMTSTYSTAMGLFAAIASGVSVPLADGLGLGWRGALSVWGGLALVAIGAWLPQVRSSKAAGERANATPGDVWVLASTETKPSRDVWTAALAWQVTLFMGLQSLLFFSLVTWLPTLLRTKGVAPGLAGWLLFGVQLVGLPATFVAPILADRMRTQRSLVAAIAGLYGAGLALLQWAEALAPLVLACILVGLAQGASISLSLTLLGLRSSNAVQAAELSGMAQSVGYLLAASGPLLVGLLNDASRGWSVPLWFLIAVDAVLLMAGLGAGRDQKIGQVHARHPSVR
ncbi:MAG: MFS transporter [Alicyclobacillus sp.]|nr:MFS transporter [Alicyclobacillus sp.]